MYETKFPVINSKIEYADMQGEVSLIDCIKLAITHHPAIMSSISNSEIYKSRVGQAWSNYFPTLSAGVSYSRNDMLMTMGGAYARMMSQNMICIMFLLFLQTCCYLILVRQKQAQMPQKGTMKLQDLMRSRALKLLYIT